MTLSAFAEVGKPKESVNATVAAASKELNELRMALPETAPEIGVASHYREQKHSDKRISSPRTFFLPRYFSAALAIPRFARLRSEGLLSPIGQSGRDYAFGRPTRRRAQILPRPRRGLPEFLRRV